MVGVIPCSEEGKSYMSFDGLERVGALWLSMGLCLELNNKIHQSKKHMSIFICPEKYFLILPFLRQKRMNLN